MADLRLAAWFLWITPLLTALSSFLEAVFRASSAASLSPEAAASRNLRTQVRSSLLTALLRSVRFSFVLMRLSCDLMFATFDDSFFGRMVAVRGRQSSSGPGVGHPCVSGFGGACMRARPDGARKAQSYQRLGTPTKPASERTTAFRRRTGCAVGDAWQSRRHAGCRRLPRARHRARGDPRRAGRRGGCRADPRR